MKIADNYHSGLAPEHAAEPCERFEAAGIVALAHDIFNLLPAEFGVCDVFYMEPPWRVGFAEFNCRAKKEHDYKAFLNRVGEVVGSLKVPVFMIAGDAAVGYYPATEFKVRVKVHGLGAQMLCYNSAPIVPAIGGKRTIPTNIECIEALALRFNCVGDLFCGYGLTGRIFVEAGKRCVLADFNPKCIGRISQISASWGKEHSR